MNLDEVARLAAEHIANHGPSDITKEALERELVSKYKDEFIAEVRAKLNGGAVDDMGFKPIQYILSPKNRYVFDYRKAAIIDVSCLAKYTGIVLFAAKQIEKSRVPVSEQVVFSSRFNPSGSDLFDKEINYGAWKERIKVCANDSGCTYVVHCDIAAFYDRVNIHRIESTLTDIKVDSSVVRKINDLLLFWSKKDSYGLPVGNSASRILAEAALIDIDQYLLSEKVKFVRYVDDYRLFAPDLVTAQRWMNKLTTRLFRDGLMLNTGKTKLRLARKEEEETVKGKEEYTAEAVIKSVTKLTGGYSRIPRTFVMPASDKFEPFKNIDIKKEIGELVSVNIPDFTGIQKLIIACLVQEKFDFLEQIASICRTYTFALDYFIDMLKKNAELIPEKNRERIRDLYAGVIVSSEFSGLEWHLAGLASLLSSKLYYSKPALLHVVRSPTKETATYPSMIALEGLSGELTRSEFKTIRDWFERCDDWERRRLIMLSGALPDEERKAWAKAVKPAIRNDLLSHRLADDVSRGKAI